MKQRHSIDLLFSLSLFMVFVICAFLVLLFQINGYHSIMDKGERLENIHTPLAYVRTQIRAHDEANAVDVFAEQEVQGLRIWDDDSKSVLYIYEQNHLLKELRVLQNVTPDFSIGNPMFELQDFKVEKRKGFFEISIISNENKEQLLRIPYQCE